MSKRLPCLSMPRQNVQLQSMPRQNVQLQSMIAVGRWFPPGTPVSSTRKLISSSFHRLDMTLAVAEALTPNTPKPSKYDHEGTELAIYKWSGPQPSQSVDKTSKHINKCWSTGQSASPWPRSMTSASRGAFL